MEKYWQVKNDCTIQNVVTETSVFISHVKCVSK